MTAETTESKKTESHSASTSSSPGGGESSKIPLILSIVNTVITVGMLAVLFVSFMKQKQTASVEDISTQPAQGEAKKEDGKSGEEGKSAPVEKGTFDKSVEESRGKLITLEQFTVNLSTPGSVSPRFARVNISLEVPNEDTEGEINAKIPQVRNAVIDLFNSKKPSDLATVEGREFLKEEIKSALDSFLMNGKVRGVFFTSFALSP